MDEDFATAAALALKGELARAGVNYHVLAERLTAMGAPQTPKAISAKINRGTFTFAFFMQCMKAIGRDVVRLGQ